MTPAMFASSRTGGWSAHILEQKRTARLVRPSAEYVGPSDADAVEHLVVDLAEVAARAAELTDERELSQLRHAVDEEIEEAARSEDFRQRAVAFRAVGQMRFRQKTELLRRGSRTTALPAAARLSCRSRPCRATTPASSTASGRCSISLRTPIRTPRFAASRSSR